MIIKKLLIDKQIKLFLMKISQEINKVAVKSYPIQSIKRRRARNNSGSYSFKF